MKLNVLMLSALLWTACSSPRTNFTPLQDGGSEDARDMNTGGSTEAGVTEPAATEAGAAEVAPPVVVTCSGNAECGNDAVCSNGQCVGKKPSIAGVSPPQGFVSNDSVFTITFTKKMDLTATVAAVAFTPALAVDASWDATGKVLTLKPKTPLVPLPASQSGNLVLFIANSAKDANGLTLDSAAPASFNYKRLHKYEAQPCSVIDTASVTAGYMGGRASAEVMSVGTSGTNVPGRVIESRAFVTFACGGTDLQQASEILAARLVLKVKTSGSPASPAITVKQIPLQNSYTSESYTVEALAGPFTLNANMPSTWSLDVKSITKLPDVKTGIYTFRAETATSPTISGYDGYDLLSLGEPQLLLDFVAP